MEESGSFYLKVQPQYLSGHTEENQDKCAKIQFRGLPIKDSYSLLRLFSCCQTAVLNVQRNSGLHAQNYLLLNYAYGSLFLQHAQKFIYNIIYELR
jgi:hypothetical protein